MKKIKIISILLLAISILPITSFGQLLRNGINTVHNPQVEVHREQIQHFLVKSDNLFRQGNYLEALNQLDLAVDAARENPEAYLHRAILRYRLGMETEANQDIEVVKTLNPVAVDLFGINGPKAQLELLAFYPEELYLDLDWIDRLSAYESILLEWHEAMNTELVTDDLPELEAATSHLANILDALSLEEWDKATSELEHLGLIKANTSILYDLKGLIALGKADLTDAVNQFRRAIQIDPSNAIAWSNLSLTQRKNNRLDSALKSADKAIGLNPTLSIAHFERGLLHSQLGMLETALEDYSYVLFLENEASLSALFNRALTSKKLGQLSSAINDLDVYIRLEPNRANAYKLRGNIYLLSGFYNKAINDFTKAVEKDNNLAEAYFNRAIAHLLNYNVLLACIDFEQSATKGYERGEAKQVYFCNN